VTLARLRPGHPLLSHYVYPGGLSPGPVSPPRVPLALSARPSDPDGRNSTPEQLFGAPWTAMPTARTGRHIGGVARVDYEQGRSQKAMLSLDPMRPAGCGRLTVASSIEDCCVRNDQLCTGTGASSSPVGCRARHHRGQVIAEHTARCLACCRYAGPERPARAGVPPVLRPGPSAGCRAGGMPSAGRSRRCCGNRADRQRPGRAVVRTARWMRNRIRLGCA